MKLSSAMESASAAQHSLAHLASLSSFIDQLDYWIQINQFELQI